MGRMCDGCDEVHNVTAYTEKKDAVFCPWCWPDEWDFPHETKIWFYP